MIFVSMLSPCLSLRIIKSWDDYMKEERSVVKRKQSQTNTCNSVSLFSEEYLRFNKDVFAHYKNALNFFISNYHFRIVIKTW